IEVITCTVMYALEPLTKFEAYHSRHMLPLAPLYKRLLHEAGVAPKLDTPLCPMFSSVTGAALEAHDLTPVYWARNLTSTVRFASATEEAFRTESGLTSVLEIGPHGALQGPIQQILGNIDRRDVNYFSTCKRDTDDMQVLLESTGKLITAGVPVSLAAINATDVMKDGAWTHEYGNVLTDLPSYQWNHSSSFWFESRLSRNARFRAFPRHELLGSRSIDDISSRARWRNHLNLNEIHWLRDVVVSGIMASMTSH
ncbi:MAG: hypothetical protein Q9193_004341, partial [Seirophora villosa]